MVASRGFPSTARLDVDGDDELGITNAAFPAKHGAVARREQEFRGLRIAASRHTIRVTGKDRLEKQALLNPCRPRGVFTRQVADPARDLANVRRGCVPVINRRQQIADRGVGMTRQRVPLGQQRGHQRDLGRAADSSSMRESRG